MKAALYVRVSTEEQAEEGFSISAQLTQLTEYCQKNNIEVYQSYVDEGVSAKYSDESKRPQFDQMIKDAEKKQFNIILVHKYDRFARNVELSQKVKRRLRKSGINVLSITEPIEDSPIGFFQEGLLELLSEYYIRNLAQESKKGHIERARQGLHNGSVPYGYRIDKITGNMVINPEQAEIVRNIFDLYVNKGYGSTKIAKVLNWSEIPSAVHGHWSHYTVSRILKNVKYIGKIEYDGVVYDAQHEPIIDNETFELTQRYMTERCWKREYRGHYYDKFLLVGLIRCGECGHVFCIHPGKFSKAHPNRRRYYYRCNMAGRIDRDICTATKNHPTDKLEQNIINTLKQAMESMPANCHIKRRSSITDTLSKRKYEIDDELKRAKQAYIKGIFSLDEYAEIKQRLEKEMRDIPDMSSHEDDAIAMQKKIKSCWDEFEAAETIADKKTVLKKIIEHIAVYRDHIEIIFYL